MKKLYLLLFCIVLLLYSTILKAQPGYVVINEYMPWTLQACPNPSEFVELYNFGPGPVNIGCYILTDGDYSITIPPNTILNEGQFYVISGLSIIPQPCSNINFTTVADLNWTTCNCTSGPIPSLLGGWLTDGGFANEGIVLMNPNLKVVDAVVRKLPQETATPITTSTVSGGCVSKTYDLDTMAIKYEEIGQSAGRGNSFARKLDGDCGWVKDPQQSGGTTNNTPDGTVSSLDAVMSITQANACSGNGSVAISFPNTSDYSTVFPVTYILAYDADSNNIMNLNDVYTNGLDIAPPTVDITGLPAGHYQVVIQPASGCNYKFFEFTTLLCNLILLEPNTFSFDAVRQTNAVRLLWTANKMDRIKKFEIERGADGIIFQKIHAFDITSSTGDVQNFKYIDQTPLLSNSYYRIKISYINNTVAYSPVKRIAGAASEVSALSLYPNPVMNVLNVKFQSKTSQDITVNILQADGKKISSKTAHVNIGSNNIQMETANITTGAYIVRISSNDRSEIAHMIYKK
jgi:Secretion system C-terminal sorting domain/Lamin Tail Domain